MKEMWDQTVRGAVLAMRPGAARVIAHQQVKCFGVGESDLEQMLPDLVRRGRQPTVGITVSKATITLRLTAEGETEAACIESMQPTIATIHECLGALVFGSGEDELQHAVARLLEAQEATLHVVEIGTRGLLNQWMAELQGEADGYRGGSVLASLDEAHSLPGMQEPGAGMAEEDPAGAVRELAITLRETLDVDYLLVAGPIRVSAGSPDDVGIDLVVATAGGAEHQWAAYRGHPDIRQSRAAKQALDFLRHQMLNAD
jgi:nicotinamide-nucleotide amidase